MVLFSAKLNTPIVVELLCRNVREEFLSAFFFTLPPSTGNTERYVMRRNIYNNGESLEGGEVAGRWLMWRSFGGRRICGGG
jgi:hypothetical protein